MKQTEENLIELQEKIEEQTKKILNLEIIIGFMGIVPFLILIMVSTLFDLEPIIKTILIATALILFIVGIFTTMKIEREVGYYECRKCNHKYIPNVMPFWLSMHFGRTRYLKCPKCHKYSWNKKVLTK